MTNSKTLNALFVLVMIAIVGIIIATLVQPYHSIHGTGTITGMWTSTECTSGDKTLSCDTIYHVAVTEDGQVYQDRVQWWAYESHYVGEHVSFTYSVGVWFPVDSLSIE